MKMKLTTILEMNDQPEYTVYYHDDRYHRHINSIGKKIFETNDEAEAIKKAEETPLAEFRDQVLVFKRGQQRPIYNR